MKRVLVGGCLLGRRPVQQQNDYNQHSSEQKTEDVDEHSTKTTSKTSKNIITNDNHDDDDDGGNDSNSSSWLGKEEQFIFEPVITPAICPSSNRQQQQQQRVVAQRFILLPQARFISVLAYNTGVKVSSLLPFQMPETRTAEDEKSDKEGTVNVEDDGDVDDESVVVSSICLATYRKPKIELKKRTIQDVFEKMIEESDDNNQEDSDQEDEDMEQEGEESMNDDDSLIVVALVGCSDGTIREFVLNGLVETGMNTMNSITVDCGPYHVSGPCLRPRRIIRVTEKEQQKQQQKIIIHLASPEMMTISSLEQGNDAKKDECLLVYALAAKGISHPKQSKKKTSSNLHCSLLRLMIPYYGIDEHDFTRSSVSPSKINLLQESSGGESASGISTKPNVVDELSCRVGRDKNGRFANTLPFNMTALKRPIQTNNISEASGHSIFVVVARSSTIHIYYEQHDTQKNLMKTFPSISFPIPLANPLSSLAVSNNKKNTDVTCGYSLGEVKVWKNLLSHVEDYHTSMTKYENHFGQKKSKKSKSGNKKTNQVSSYKPEHPSKKVIISKLHWHAHPVTSLAYDSASSRMDPILYSGGDESVLVTWQLSQGTYRPAHVLPRLALGGIVHVTCAEDLDNESRNGVLVYCEDNSLQLFESHNKTLLWKVQGLASAQQQQQGTQDYQNIGSDICSIEADPRGNGSEDSHLIVTGLSYAPGVIHWYDPHLQKVSASLEVAPFNRVSKTLKEDCPLPAPAITNHSFSATGNDLITIDETPTENASVGARTRQEDGMALGAVTTIRFWFLNDRTKTGSNRSHRNSKEPTMPYRLSAAMTFPHGPKNRVDGLTISNDGTFACTISNDEKAFRVWYKAVTSQRDDENEEKEDEIANGQRVPAWTCQYKVTIPSAFSNFRTGRDAAAFSEDASILVICFGSIITVWDSLETRFLTSLRHLEGDRAAIESITFVSTSSIPDLLLSRSSSGIALQSVFPDTIVGNFEGWSWGIPEGIRGIFVSDAKMVESHGCVAVTICNKYTFQSRVVLIDALTGKLYKSASEGNRTSSLSAVVDDIGGCIRSIGVVGKAMQIRSNWNREEQDEEGINDSPLRVYCLTSFGELVLIKTDDEDHGDGTNRKETSGRMQNNSAFGSSMGDAPRLDLGHKETNSQRRKRQRTALSTPVDTLAMSRRSKTSALEMFGSIYGEDSNTASAAPMSSDLPALSGPFVRAFVGRTIYRSKEIE